MEVESAIWLDIVDQRVDAADLDYRNSATVRHSEYGAARSSIRACSKAALLSALRSMRRWIG